MESRYVLYLWLKFYLNVFSWMSVLSALLWQTLHFGAGAAAAQQSDAHSFQNYPSTPNVNNIQHFRWIIWSVSERFPFKTSKRINGIVILAAHRLHFHTVYQHLTRNGIATSEIMCSARPVRGRTQCSRFSSNRSQNRFSKGKPLN